MHIHRLLNIYMLSFEYQVSVAAFVGNDNLAPSINWKMQIVSGRLIETNRARSTLADINQVR